MKDARYLIRLANHANFQPADQARLLSDVRRLAQVHHGRVMNLRVSPFAIEFDLFYSPDEPLEQFFQAWAPIGRQLTVKRLDVPPQRVDPPVLIKEAITFFQEQRFWEVHEILEGLWRETHGAEKQWVQGLILLAASLVHVQKNEMDVAWKMMEDALLRLESAPKIYYEWNLSALQRGFKEALSRRKIEIPID